MGRNGRCVAGTWLTRSRQPEGGALDNPTAPFAGPGDLPTGRGALPERRPDGEGTEAGPQFAAKERGHAA
eukprot:5403752-Alexandrium_andersonii.AAC.1